MSQRRCAIYARVSSALQRDRHTIESQLPACRELAARLGLTVVGEYIDDGFTADSGYLDERGGLLRLLADAQAGRFDVVVTFDDDRLTRSDRLRERGYILGTLQEAGVGIATVMRGAIIDLDTDEGDLQISFGALQSSSWLRKHKRRIKEGKARAIAEGRKPAGPTPYGLTYSRATGTWSIDPERAEVVREIYRRVIAGDSCMAIADDLYARGVTPPRGPWERHKVWALVRSSHPMGRWVADKRKRLTVAVPAILDEATWHAAQAKLIEHGKRGLQRTTHVYLLERLAVCGVCGSPMAIRSATHNRRRGYTTPAAYVCRARKLARRGEGRCRAEIVPVADIDARVWAAIAARLVDPELAARVHRCREQRRANRRGWQSDVRDYQARLAQLAKVEEAVLKRWRAQLVSEDAFDRELAAIAASRAAVTAQLEQAQRAAGRPDELEADPEAWLAGLRRLAETAGPAARQRVVRAIVEPGAVFDGDQVHLTLQVDPGPGAAAPSLVEVPDFRTDHGNIRLRLVA